ncbi:MAG: 1-acyl-sn-glycerol-3-phosphate acyltransferase [Deltaproteobacteria bacterium]|nr:1-acyl-sn-glycerol-3-phosphate acyltransferase [Deltaproteobacteria bacterium]
MDTDSGIRRRARSILPLRFLRDGVAAARRVHGDVGAKDFALSAAAWAAGLAWGVPALTTLTVLAGNLGLRPERLQRLYAIYADVQLRLLGVRWRAEVDPAVNPRTPYFFFQNHVNHFDFIACHNATPHYRQGIELDEHFRIPLYGPFMRSRGTIAVRKGGAGRLAELRNRCREELALGRSILAFPEGTRTLDGKVGPFKTGLFVVARDLGTPIVPVAVRGTWNLMRKGSALLRPGAQVVVHVGAPVPTRDVTDEGLPALVAAVHDWIAEHAEGGERLSRPNRGLQPAAAVPTEAAAGGPGDPTDR